MRELRLNREINPNGQILRDDKGNLTGISLSSDLVKIRNLSIDTLTSSTGTIPTEGSLYFEGSEGLRFNLVDSFTEKSGALTSLGDVAVGMNRWANAATQFWIYEPIASPVDYFNITVLANGATSISTIDIAGSDASLSLSSDGDLNFSPSTGDVLIPSTVSEKPQLTLKNTTNDTNGSSIKFLKDKGSAAADNDIIGSLTFYGDNDAQQETQFASIVSSIADASDGVEGGKLEFQVASHDGEIVTGLSLTDGSAEDEIDVTIASGAASVTTVAGHLSPQGAINLAQDMYLTVGNVEDYIYGDGSEIYIGKDGSDIVTYKDAEILQEVPLKIVEAASAVADTASYGQIWVKTATPNELYFTNDAGNDIQLTSGSSIAGGGGGGSTTLVWHQTIGGYRLNNTSTSSYYTFYRFWNENWGNLDSSPTNINTYDAYASFMITPAAGTLTGIKIVGRASDTGFDDPFKFYMFKGTVANDATSVTCTAIATTSAITPTTSGRTFTHNESFSSSNSFSAGDSLYIWLKKDSNSGNQDLYFNITVFGEYS